MALDSSQQRAMVHAPSYGDGVAGRTAFSRDVVARLMGLGLGFEPARLFAAHVARETGWGRAVWDNNFGNIKAQGGWTGPFFVLTDRLGFTDPYRAYATPDEGLAAVVRLVSGSPRYAGAWSQLLAGDPNWYGTLGMEGYYEGPPDPSQPGVHQPVTPANVAGPQGEYDDVLDLVRRYVPSPPVGTGSGTLLALLGAGLAVAAAGAAYATWRSGQWPAWAYRRIR